MIITIKFSTGKEIELTEEEYKELQRISIYSSPIPQYPDWNKPFIYEAPTITCRVKD